MVQYSLQPGNNPVLWIRTVLVSIRIRIQHFWSMRIRIQDFHDQRTEKSYLKFFKYIFLIKIAIYFGPPSVDQNEYGPYQQY